MNSPPRFWPPAAPQAVRALEWRDPRPCAQPEQPIIAPSSSDRRETLTRDGVALPQGAGREELGAVRVVEGVLHGRGVGDNEGTGRGWVVCCTHTVGPWACTMRGQPLPPSQLQRCLPLLPRPQPLPAWQALHGGAPA